MNKGLVYLGMEKRYTEPQLKKNKAVWFFEYYYDGKRIRETRKINKEKDINKKQHRAIILLKAISEELAEGYNPTNPTVFIEKVKRETILLTGAIKEYIEVYHPQIKSRPDTIKNYYAKLRYLSDHYPDIQLKDLTTTKIESYCLTKCDEWSNTTMGICKIYFNGFFEWAISREYIKTNPMQKFNKSIRGHKEVAKNNLEYTEKDFNAIMKYADANDQYLAFVLRFLYYTCIRPQELRQLTIDHIDFENETLYIPASISKNKKSETIVIPNQLMDILNDLNLDQYPKNYYLNGCTKNIIGKKMVGTNTPLNKMKAVFKALGIEGKGYTLYSIKYFAGSARMRTGVWDLATLKTVNRHSDVQMTERYVRGLSTNTVIRDLEVPTI